MDRQGFEERPHVLHCSVVGMQKRLPGVGSWDLLLTIDEEWWWIFGEVHPECPGLGLPGIMPLHLSNIMNRSLKITQINYCKGFELRTSKIQKDFPVTCLMLLGLMGSWLLPNLLWLEDDTEYYVFCNLFIRLKLKRYVTEKRTCASKFHVFSWNFGSSPALA